MTSEPIFTTISQISDKEHGNSLAATGNWLMYFLSFNTADRRYLNMYRKLKTCRTNTQKRTQKHKTRRNVETLKNIKKN